MIRSFTVGLLVEGRSVGEPLALDRRRFQLVDLAHALGLELLDVGS